MPAPEALDPAYLPMATAVGEAWARETASQLRAADRDVVGSWPGTMREAQSRVLTQLPADVRAHHSLRSDALLLLTRTTYEAARRSWQAISEPDVEP